MSCCIHNEPQDIPQVFSLFINLFLELKYNNYYNLLFHDIFFLHLIENA